MQFYPPVPFLVHEFVKRVLKQVEKYLANLAFAAADHCRRGHLRIGQTNVMCPKPLRT
jgi:hypothetical protein